MPAKVSVIGSGFVGGTTAYGIISKDLADVVLLDVVEGIPQGKALDIMQAGAVEGFGHKVKGSNSYEDISGSKIVVVTAGISRKPGMSRLDLLKKNASVIKAVTENIVKYAPDSMILIVTNPLDVMTYEAFKVSGFPPQRVFGQAGILDSARFSYFISEELGVPVKNISAMVLGGHGDSMVPLPRYTTVSGKSITKLLSKEALERLVERTRKGGGEIVSLLKTGSAYYAPASSVVHMVEAILKDKKTVMPVSAYLRGEYGLNDIYIGVPVTLGAGGVEKIEELELTKEEKDALSRSAEIYKEGISALEGA
ncbi:MAG: malate dehydrogenase [bacterium]